ncbi:translation protein SH3-like domain-containing protein [Boletus reticuloceps]|uniref:Large ribosomal subunit protein uL2m n=1 Tax=Boletus reticuloceps TaxID=495285 RepID=A0A8I2YLZ0_9AGAM|nr:translation protein SH3-like domain-containing protein [Boletus reticuloceps]KAG6373588.1 translation protein SH3-like domain-containing protein [Boletus reticuloceps]
MLGLRHLLRNVAHATPRSTTTTPATLRALLPTGSRAYAARTTHETIPSYDTVITEFKTYKPITPGIRHLRRPLNAHLYKGKPIRVLTTALRRKGGRNATGRITVRFRGGGHRRRIRIVDFMRMEPGPHDVVRIEYDPGRSGHIALLKARDPNAEGNAKWKYILAPEGVRAGDVVESYRSGLTASLIQSVRSADGDAGEDHLDKKTLSLDEITQHGKDQSTSDALLIGILRGVIIKLGNCVPIKLIPTGTMVHNVSLDPRGKAILVRAAGTFAQVVHHEENGRYSHIRLQSGEVRKVLSNCVATIGRVSNPLWDDRKLGKAGRNRWLGWRPRVRGVAMNACDHPHGGGRGKSKSDKHPVSIWGWGTKGTRTRKPGPKTNKMVIKERPRGKEKASKS